MLAPQTKPNLSYKLIASGPTGEAAAYFGQTAQFPLPTSIPVKKGELVALTVPTWAPALALNFANATSWRASRSKAECTSTSTQTGPHPIGTSVQYYCLYQTARLTYCGDADLHALSGRRLARPARAPAAGRWRCALRRARAAGRAGGARFFGGAGFAGGFFGARRRCPRRACRCAGVSLGGFCAAAAVSELAGSPLDSAGRRGFLRLVVVVELVGRPTFPRWCRWAG